MSLTLETKKAIYQLPIEKEIDENKAAFTGRLEVHMLPERKGADVK